jgi:hypothetical protein
MDIATVVYAAPLLLPPLLLLPLLLLSWLLLPLPLPLFKGLKQPKSYDLGLG